MPSGANSGPRRWLRREGWPASLKAPTQRGTSTRTFSRKPVRHGLRTGLAVLIIPVVVAAGVLFGAAPASAETVAVTYGYGFATQDATGFYGQLRDTTTPDGYCVEMQRKTRTQEWVTSGFWSGLGPDGGTEIHVVAC